MKKKDIVSEPPIIKALNKEKRPLEDKTDKILPRAKRHRNSSMSESAISQVSFNMSMMENPLMKNFILDISNYSENLETIEDTTPDLQMQITPSIDGEIEPFIEDFESSASIVDSPVKFVFRPPVPKIKTLTKRVLESTLKVITETSTLDERLLNTTNLPDGLYNDLNLQFQAIAEQTARKIQQVNRKCDLNFNSVLEQMQQLKKCAAEKKTAISQLLDLVKQASSVKKKLIALDQKERKS